MNRQILQESDCHDVKGWMQVRKTRQRKNKKKGRASNPAQPSRHTQHSTMSFFGGGMQSQQAINPQNVAMAEQELEMVTDLFNR